MMSGPFDRLLAAIAVMRRPTPAFFVGVVLMRLRTVRAGLAPAAGHGADGRPVLPALTPGPGLAAMHCRVGCSAVAETVTREPLRFARQKGPSLGAALSRHRARNAAVPLVASLGMQMALLLGSVVVVAVESVFAWSGIGRGLTHAIFGRDVAMLQGTALTLGLFFVPRSLLVDPACRALDPPGRR